MKINSLSKAVLTAMLVSGTLATTTPIHAAAETPSAVTEVNTQQTKGADVQATIVTNDDGTKTVKVTIPADQVVDGSAKGGTFTATTNDDTDAEVDSGSVKQSKNKVKFNIELNKDALSNQKLLTEDLTITLADSKGNEIGKISELTLQDLLASSEDGVSESSSSKASSQNTNDSSTSSKAESTSAKSESSDTKAGSSAQSDSDKTTGSSATSTSESGSKAESSSTTALSPDTPANDTVTSTADAGSTANSNGQSNQANNSSSNSDQNVTSFKSVKEMEQYASQHGNSSVNGKTVTTSVQDVKQDSKDGNYANSGQTWFTGDNAVEFHSDNLYQISTGETVTVKISSYNPADNDTPAHVEFTSLQQVNGSSSAAQTGQSGNAPTATTLPQTGNDRNDGVVQSGVGIFGLVSAAVAALGLRKRN